MQQILEYSFARILVRLIGVVLVLWGAMAVVSSIVYALGTLIIDSTRSWTYILPYSAGSALSGLVVGLIGLGLARDGHAIARLVTRNMHGRCRRCGYDIRTISAPNCPECSAPIVRPENGV